MDLSLSEEQVALVESFASLFAKFSSAEAVRAAEPQGFDSTLWRALIDTGVMPMAIGEAAGGWGASLVDMVLLAEQAGRASAAAPVVETQVAARLLEATASPTITETLTAILEGQQLVTLALHPVQAGQASLVPAGAVCHGAVVLEGDALLLLAVDDHNRQPINNLGSAPLADIAVGSATRLAEGPRALELYESAVDEWLLLTAATLVGSATRAHEIACQYAVDRHAFGSPIGAFQGIAHPLANDATNLDGAQLLARRAAWEADRAGPRTRELAAMAFAFASVTAEQATYNALHTHGGYGFMLEYDVQLHWRRVRGWARVWGDADAGYRRAANARYGMVA